MDRVTFDFETEEVIWDTDHQKGTELVPGLSESREAILAAAGFEAVNLKKEMHGLFKELGIDGQITV